MGMTDHRSHTASQRTGALRGGFARFLSVFLIVLALLWIGGLLTFVWHLEHPVTAAEPQADGIVVLTGGAQRLDAGIALLEQGRAKRLLITGVAPETGAKELSGVTIGSRELFACCVDLGTSAHNTRGNALEAADWARKNNYRSLIIVTANYHMPRSLLEFRAVMPGVLLIAYPVAPTEFKLADWWRHPGTTTLLASEYSKYLVSLVLLGPVVSGQAVAATRAS